jgi:polyphosphate glucokinase
LTDGGHETKSHVVLAVDVGGSHVKLLTSNEKEHRRFKSGPKLAPQRMVDRTLEVASEWYWDAVSVGIPTPVRGGNAIAEPINLGEGWIAFDFAAAFGKPTKVVNDAVMQAIGSYEGGRMLFLGLGTGLGSALIVEGIVEPLELGHLPFRKRTFEDYVSRHALEKHGKTKWQAAVFETVEHLSAAIQPDYVVLGGGEAEELDRLPDNCRLGSNANAFVGGFRLWEPEWIHRTHGGVGDVAG